MNAKKLKTSKIWSMRPLILFKTKTIAKLYVLKKIICSFYILLTISGHRIKLLIFREEY